MTEQVFTQEDIAAFHDAAGFQKNADLMKAYIAKGIDVNITDEKGETALHCACHYGDTEIVELLITHGANVNVATQSGTTPLMIVANQPHIIVKGNINTYENKLAILRLLLQHGANPLAELSNRKTMRTVLERCKDGHFLEVIKDHMEGKRLERVYLDVPYDEKDQVKALGAKWDADRKKWYYLLTNDEQLPNALTNWI